MELNNKQDILVNKNIDFDNGSNMNKCMLKYNIY